MSALRILIAAQNHPGLVPGGTEIVAHDLFRSLRSFEGVRATFVGCVTRLHREPRAGSLIQGIGGAEDELLFWTGAYDRFLMSRLDGETFAASWAMLLERTAPDVVHFHSLDRLGPEVVPLTRRLRPRAKIVVTLHDYQPICFNDGLMVRRDPEGLCSRADPDSCHRCFPEIAPERFALRREHLLRLLDEVDAFVAPSRFIAERFVAWGVARERIVRIDNPAHEAATPHAASGDDLRTRFGFFGNLVPHKGVLVLLEAARRLAERWSHIRITLNGGMHFPQGAFREAVETALANLPNVARAGAYDRDELASRMRGVGWVVVPSLWWENAPLVIQEAFRHGRPVICSGIGGMAEMVTDGVNGLHVAPGDAAGLADAMLRASSEPGLWERLHGGVPTVPTPLETGRKHLALYRGPIADRSKEALSA